MSPVSVSFILKFFYASTKCFLLQAELLKVLDALLQALPCSGTLTCVHMLPTGGILGQASTSRSLLRAVLLV